MKKFVVAILLVAALCIGVIAGGNWALRRWVEQSAECERSMLATSESPDGAWTAILEEHVCSTVMFGSTTVDAAVLLRQAVHQQGTPQYIFSVDTHSGPEMRPLVQWTASRALQITVPNKSLIGLRKRDYDGVKIVVLFNPDAPEERAQFLKGLGLPPE